MRTLPEQGEVVQCLSERGGPSIEVVDTREPCWVFASNGKWYHIEELGLVESPQGDLFGYQ